MIQWLEQLNSGTLPQWGTFLGVITGLIGLVVVFVKGIPDRKRAANEGTTAESQASELQFKRMGEEMDRLTARVETLEKTGAAKDTLIAELTALKLEALAERAAERVLNTAALAERDATIAALRASIAANSSTPPADSRSLVKATEHVAEATGRVADAAELAVKGDTK